MPETSVTGSSSITYIEWYAGTLFVLMRDGSKLTYTGVPQEEYDNLVEADSKGAYFNQHIRNGYSFSYG